MCGHLHGVSVDVSDKGWPVLFSSFCNLWAYVHNDYICEEGSSTFLCVSTLHILPVSLVRGRDTRQSLFLCRSASAQINRPVKTCRVVVGPPRLSTGRRWHCFLVHPDNQGLGLGQECLVGLNVRRSTARMQPLLLITHDLCQLRNKSWLDFYL